MQVLNKKELIKLINSMPDELVFWVEEKKCTEYLKTRYLMNFGSDYYDESIDE